MWPFEWHEVGRAESRPTITSLCLSWGSQCACFVCVCRCFVLKWFIFRLKSTMHAIAKAPCVSPLWTEDNLCVHSTPARSLLGHPKCNYEGKLGLFISGAAENLIITDGAAGINVGNCGGFALGTFYFVFARWFFFLKVPAISDSGCLAHEKG